MYSPKQTLVSTFVSYLQETYESVFGQGEHHHVDFLGSVAGMVLDTIAQSDALYHDLEHTILVTSVGQEILQAKQLCEGPESVTSRDWLHLMIALLCHDIGYCKGICQQDDCDLGRQTTGLGDEYVFLPFGSTDASLSNYHEIGRHTSELQSPVPISYAVFCLKKKNPPPPPPTPPPPHPSTRTVSLPTDATSSQHDT